MKIDKNEHTAIIKKLLKKAKAYKNSPGFKSHILLEWYGFILGLSKEVEEENLKVIILKKIVSAIQHFILKDMHALNGVELKNLAANFNSYRTKLENIRLETEELFIASQYKNFLSHVGEQFRELVDDMLDYAQRILGPPPCAYTLLCLGSLATHMVTPYSDVEYLILIDKQVSKTYFEKLGDLFELFIIGFGESPIGDITKDKIRSALTEEEYNHCISTFRKGICVDEYQKPQVQNHLYELINTPEELLRFMSEPDKIIYQQGNYLTSALLTTTYLGKKPSMKSLYQMHYLPLFEQCLQTQDFYECLYKLLKQAVANCKQLERDLENLRLRKKHLVEEQKPIYEIKSILEQPLHLARLLALFLKASGEDISLHANFFDTIESLKDSHLRENYNTWLELVERLLPKRLELQIESRSAEARMTLAQLNTLYPFNELCLALNSIARRVETILNDRSELKLPHSVAQVLKAVTEVTSPSPKTEPQSSHFPFWQAASSSNPLSSAIIPPTHIPTMTSTTKRIVQDTSRLEDLPQTNKAYQHFICNEEEQDQHLYDIWYSGKSITYLLHSWARTAASPLLPYVFLNQATPGCSFSEQFEQLRIIRNSIQQDICFIASESDSVQVPHFICGILTAHSLLVINPIGLSKHHDFNQALEEIHKRYQLTIYLSTNTLQKESGGLVSCGPICVELALHLLVQAKEEWTSLLKMLIKSGKGKEQAGAWLYRVDISPLLPSMLQDISQLPEDDYQERLLHIRAAHGDQLIAVSSNLPIDLSENTFWDQCENADIQVVMNQLCLEKKAIIEVQETHAFQRLTGKMAAKFISSLEAGDNNGRVNIPLPTSSSASVPTGISCKYTYAPVISCTDVLIEIEHGATLPSEWSHLLSEKLMGSSSFLSQLTEQETLLFETLLSNAPSTNIDRPIAVKPRLKKYSVKVKFLGPSRQHNNLEDVPTNSSSLEAESTSGASSHSVSNFGSSQSQGRTGDNAILLVQRGFHSKQPSTSGSNSQPPDLVPDNDSDDDVSPST